MSASWRALLGFLLGCLVWLWSRTLRVTLSGSSPAGASVFGFWHGQQLALARLAVRRKLTTLVSHSRDGQLQRGVMRALGVSVVRGSSSRGGARGLCAMVRRLREGGDLAFALDGPRGPLRRAKPGAAAAAQLGRAGLVPVGVCLERRWVLERAWDRFELPWPFSRVVVVLGDPLEPATTTPEELERAMLRAERRAARALGRADGRPASVH